MENLEEKQQPQIPNWKVVLYIISTFVLFVFALDLMIASFQHLGRDTVGTILQATSNPFTALFIGLLITAMIQSSSTTTSLVVALVAAGSIRMEAAIPIVMGANVGTTITSTIVSLGFISKKKEFRRAVIAGTYHDFFNILTVVILFPLEYYYGFLSKLGTLVATRFFDVHATPKPVNFSSIWHGFDPVIQFLVGVIPSGFVLALLSFGLLFLSILVFRRLISKIFMSGSLKRIGSFFFKNTPKAFFWGIVTTAAIRSSTITTSMVVPITAQKIINMKKAVPFILGANLGTTITAFMAAALNASNKSAISIAVVHFLFNFIGVLIWYPLPWLRQIPLGLASWLGKLTLKYRLVGLVYILLFFFFLPFSLIYLSKDSVQIYEVNVHRVELNTNTESDYKVVSKTRTHNDAGEWLVYKDDNDDPAFIYPVYARGNTLFAANQMFIFSKQGSCWDGEINGVKSNTCIDTIQSKITLESGLVFDSVYVFRQQYIEGADTTIARIHISKNYPLILKKDVAINGVPVSTESITSLKRTR